MGGLGHDLEDSAIVAAVVSLADTLGLSAVAEGVETELQRECLVGLGCVQAQGYLFARPRDSADVGTALDQAASQAGLFGPIPAIPAIDPADRHHNEPRRERTQSAF